MAEGLDKGQVVVREVEVRLVRGEERRRWDELMERHHYLGFRQFAGRGLRQVAEWRGQWLALVGWQSGAFKCGVRDRWLGWHRSVQFRRLHLIGNNTRFLILPEAEGIANLGSRVLGRSLRRVSGDWEAAHGHGLELAETFVDPARFHGGVYDATNWVRVGRTKGFARHNGAYTDAHEEPKEMFVRALRREAWGAGAVGGPGGPPGVELSGDEGVLHAGGVAVVAGVVCTDAGLPPWSGAQAPAGDGAGGLRLGAVVGVERAGGDGTVCETPEPGGVAGAGGRGGTPRRAGGWRRRTRLCAGWWRTPTRTPCRTC